MTGKRHIVSKICFLSLFFILTFAFISKANAQNVTSGSTIIDRLDKRLGVSVPAEFGAKLLDFVLNDTIMRTRSATAYTEEFIIKEMEKDWGISKQHQLLFIWSKIYGGISQKKLYNRLDDENSERAGEYKKSLKQIASCYEAYKKGFKIYMETKSAEYDRRTADAQQRSADAQKNIMQKDTLGLKEMVKFYSLYTKNPNNITPEEIEKSKKLLQRVIPDCKEYGIDYRAILLKEVGDKRKVDAILKFYGVE